MVAKGDDTMDTMLLINEKDTEIQQLRDELEKTKDELKAVKASKAAPPASPAPPPPPVASPSGSADAAAAEQRADKAELEPAELKQQFTKLQAKLNAVSTLYTEAAQREAVLRLQLEQTGGAAKPSYE